MTSYSLETYSFLQHYWWLLVSLLGALLVFLLFVQGGQTFLIGTKKDKVLNQMLVNSTGRKWEFTLTTLVTFGGAFFASFPLFYSTSFGGAYWVWIITCLMFVIQAISYEYQSKHGNVLGKKGYQTLLVINGIMAPLLLGAIVSTLFMGGNFTIDKSQIYDFGAMRGAISEWSTYNGVMLHGLEAVLNPWNLVLGVAVLFLARVTGLLYFINNIDDSVLQAKARKSLPLNAIIFVVLFVAYVVKLITMTGLRYSPSALDPGVGSFVQESFLYWHNLLQMPIVLIIFLVGVLLVLLGIGLTLFKKNFRKGVWIEGVGVVLAVLAMLLLAGWNNTAYYPSLADAQSSLSIKNSSSSFYTLRAMSYVSILIPFVLAYIWFAWKSIDSKKITRKEIESSEHTY
ncbi:putative cytochrome d ubiquinol oxidase, subunit II [Bacteroidales bacterium KA00251]|nr:putative cytochrome d ubiquinol oxidase, subunit II [Bacteroidales bacterium KA00251]